MPWLILLIAGAFIVLKPKMVLAYVKGKPAEVKLAATVTGKLLRSDAAAAFDEMYQAAKKDGINLYVTSGFRSMEEQQKLYDQYKKADGNLAAKPGYSKHQSGIAVDISVGNNSSTPQYQWLASHASEYGFENTGKNFKPPEPWHWEYVRGIA